MRNTVQELRQATCPRSGGGNRLTGGANFVDVAGATAAIYALAPVQFANDRAVFRVDGLGSGGNTVLVSSHAGMMLVSSMPAVVFADSEFDRQTGA